MRLWLYPVLAATVVLGAGGGSPEPAGPRCELSPELEAVAEACRTGGEARALDLARSRAMRVVGRGLPVILEPAPGASSDRIDRVELGRRGFAVAATSRSFMRVVVPPGRLAELKGLPGARRARPPSVPKCLGEPGPARAERVPPSVWQGGAGELGRRFSPRVPALPAAGRTPAANPSPNPQDSPPVAPAALPGLGTVVSESVALTGAAELHAAGLTGAGVKAAVVDLGFIGLQARIDAGELPAGTVKVALSGQTVAELETYTEHGAGVAEHLADMAPGAELHCIRVDDEVDLQNAADYLATEGIKVANHSVGWVNASYYDDTGVINGIFNESRDTDGVFWAVAAGNDNGYHWRGGWLDADADSLLEFAAGDEGLDLVGTYSTAQIFLNWNQYGSSVTDLDLYVYNKRDRLVASSTASQTGAQDPAEKVSFAYSTKETPYRIEVKWYAGPTTGLDITVFSFNHKLEHAVAASSFMDPADAHGAFAVAAVDYRNWPGLEPAPEPFSSQGPTNDGRMKPDLAAPDGTSSVTYGAGASYGTSFSSPTVAGAAVLVLAANPTWTAGQVEARLKQLALDLGDSGQDAVYGCGKLDLRGLVSTPSISAVTLVRPAEGTDVPRYSRLELEVTLAGLAAPMPYLGDARAGGVDLSATFSGPGGRVVTVPGFYDGSTWRVRFAPDVLGDWSYALSLEDKSGLATWSGGAFACTASTLHGPVRVDGRKLRHADGTVFFGVGHNNGWQYNVEQPVEGADPPPQPTFAEMAAGGENLLSFWNAVPWAETATMPQRAPAETVEDGLGRYNQSACAYLDSLVDGAEAAGVYLLPTVWSHGQLRDTDHAWSGATPGENNWWYNNAYKSICSTPTAFFRTTGAGGAATRQWRYQRNWYRYLLARWGSSQAVAGFVALCEADGTNAWAATTVADRDRAALQEWCGKVRQFFADGDPYRRNASGQVPVSASMVNNPSFDGGFSGGLDLRCVDHYTWSQDNVAIAQSVATEAATMWSGGRPGFHAEFGGAASEGDTQPLHLHNGIWAGAASGAAVAPLVWCDGYDFTLVTPEMRGHLGYLGRFMAAMPWLDDAALAPASVSASGTCRGWGMKLADKGFAWVQATSGTVSGQTVTVAGLAQGSYLCRWFDTWAVSAEPAAHSSTTVTVGADGVLNVTVPALAQPDAAMVFTPGLPPVAADDSYSVAEDGRLTVLAAAGVLANDTDPESGALTAELVTGPAHGALTLAADGSFTYTPEADYHGADSFTYRAVDPQGLACEATAGITVTAVPDPPTAHAQSVTTAEEAGKAIVLTGSDPDGDTLTFTVTGGPSHGVLTGTAPDLTYTPAADYHGPDGFSFKVNDGMTDSADATVSITVTPVNDEPEVSNHAPETPFDMDEGTSQLFEIWATDADGDAPIYSWKLDGADVPGATGSSWTYSPGYSAAGAHTLAVTVSDGNGGSVTFTWTINVQGVNRPPTADAQSVSTAEEAAKAITLTGSDPDAGDTLTFTVVTGPAHGALTGTAPDLVYTPTANYNGTDSFTFKVNDGTVDSTEATVSITVTAVNDAPTISDIPDQITAEDTPKGPLAFSIGDVETAADSLTLSATSSNTALLPAANIVFGGSGADRTVTLTPAADQSGSATVTVTVTDGGGLSASDSLVLTVTAGNNPPTVSDIADRAIAEDSSTGDIAFTVGDTETSADALVVSATSSDPALVPPTGITLGGSGANRTVSVTPAANGAGTATITVTATDAGGLSASDQFVLTVTAVNDAPTADAQSVSTAEGASKAITLTGSDPDAGDTLTFTVVTGPAHGSLSGTAPELVYTPAAGYFGADSFTFVANDGTVDSTEATVSITVTAAPPAIALSTATLSPSCRAGKNAAAQSFTVENSGGGTLAYTIADDVDWLSCSPAAGSSTGEADPVTVTYATSGLAVGVHVGTITVTAPGAGNTPQTVTVTLTVSKKKTSSTSSGCSLDGEHSTAAGASGWLLPYLALGTAWLAARARAIPRLR